MLHDLTWLACVISLLCGWGSVLLSVLPIRHVWSLHVTAYSLLPLSTSHTADRACPEHCLFPRHVYCNLAMSKAYAINVFYQLFNQEVWDRLDVVTVPRVLVIAFDRSTVHLAAFFQYRRLSWTERKTFTRWDIHKLIVNHVVLLCQLQIA